jgi:hypothetical protein
MGEPMAATPLDGSWEIPIGASVFTADDRRLGYVVETDSSTFVVGEGFLFRRYCALALEEVERYADGVLVLKYTWEQVMERAPRV